MPNGCDVEDSAVCTFAKILDIRNRYSYPMIHIERLEENDEYKFNVGTDRNSGTVFAEVFKVLHGEAL